MLFELMRAHRRWNIFFIISISISVSISISISSIYNLGCNFARRRSKPEGLGLEELGAKN
jgi:hypothetical protein